MPRYIRTACDIALHAASLFKDGEADSLRAAWDYCCDCVNASPLARQHAAFLLGIDA